MSFWKGNSQKKKIKYVELSECKNNFVVFFKFSKNIIMAFQEKRGLCQKYWWLQDDFGAITWNVSTGYMTIYLYRNGKCNLAKALKCLEKLTKESEKSNKAATLDE